MFSWHGPIKYLNHLHGYPVLAFTSTRLGGVSHPPFDSLNLGGGIGDEERLVLENKRLLSEVAGQSLVELKQVHGNLILEVTSQSQSMGEGDGMVTREVGVPLLIKHADCQAMIAYDPVNHALGVAHAGWKGLIQEIYKHLLEKMKSLYGTDPSSLVVSFSPSLGPERSEFKNYKEELPKWALAYEEKPLHFNLWKIALDQLIQLGVPKGSISPPPCCSYEEKLLFFSYRRDRLTGRNGTVALLLPLHHKTT